MDNEQFMAAVDGRDWYTAAQILGRHCSADIGGLDTWLADGDVAHIRSQTVAELAAEWDSAMR